MSVFDNFPFRTSDGRTSLTSLSVRHIITPRRTGITIAGAFACVGIASAINMGAASGSNKANQSQPEHTVQLKLEKKASSTTEPSSADTSPPPAPKQHVQSSVTFQQSTTSQGNETPTTTHKVTVNGKNVPVPSNGTVKKVITDKDGNTSVNISSSTNGSANNSSSSSISVNVSSDSSTSTSSNGDVEP